MTDKKTIKLIWERLQNKGSWYLDPSAPDIPEFIDIAEKAKTYADFKLTHISYRTLLKRYELWHESDKILSPTKDYFDSFLDDLVFDLGSDVLYGEDKDRFYELCNLTIKWLR